jgi:hypothetical protein
MKPSTLRLLFAVLLGLSTLSSQLSTPLVAQQTTRAGNLVVTGTASVAGTLTAPTAAAGTNTTQVATTAFVNAKVDPLVNARQPRQGLVFDGTAGATTSMPALGAGDFSVSFFASKRVANAGRAFGGNSALAVSLNDTSVSFTHTNIAEIGAISFTASVDDLILYSIVRRSGQLELWVNKTYIGSIANSTNFSFPNTILGGYEGAADFFNGTISGFYPYNYALTAAQVSRLFTTGAPDAVDMGGSKAALNTGAFTNHFGPSTAFTGASATGFSATITAQSGIARSAPSFAVRAGQRFLVTGTVSSISNAWSAGLISTGGALVSVAYQNVSTNGNFSLVITAAQDATAHFFFVGSVGAVSSGTFSNLSVTPLGCLLALDANQTGAGFQWADTSGNRADITLPASGVTWALPTETGAHTVRGRLTWAGTHEAKSLLGQIALPSSAVVRSITLKATTGSSGSGLTVGTTNSATRWVAATTYTTAKRTLTVANALPAGTAGVHLDIVVDPDTANYTGSLDLTVAYDLTTGTP